jgi:tRNA (guanine37-N1)-methyltransferase
MTLRIDVCTTFPDMVASYMGESIMARACTAGLVDFYAHDLRDYTHDPHRTTDDYPYGGGSGLLMKCEPIFECMEDILPADVGALPYLRQPFKNAPEAAHANLQAQVYGEGVRVAFLSPHGRRFDDAYACELSQAGRIVFVCGRYEGIDERVYSLATDVIALGDFVLTGGELAALCVIDATVRKLPGALGAVDGATDESFSACTGGLLEYPQYTRPATYRDMVVPDVLLSGHHARIAQWQREQALANTAALRPDLIERARTAGALGEKDERYLSAI